MVKKILKQFISRDKRNSMRVAWQSVIWPFYFGYKYYCPCCETGFRKFLHFWGRDNIRCPRCNSLDRYRLQWLYLQNRTNLFSQGLKVLHFAPEAIFFEKLKKMPNLNYITADLMVSFIDGICASPDCIMSICDIHFPDQSFDVVLCNHVLEHVPDDRRAMAEIYRVLKKGGRAILQVPLNKDSEYTAEDPNIISGEDRMKYYGSPDHVRLYGRDYKERLESVGFTVNVDPYVRELPSPLIEKYRLDTDEDIYIAHKI